MKRIRRRKIKENESARKLEEMKKKMKPEAVANRKWWRLQHFHVCADKSGFNMKGNDKLLSKDWQSSLINCTETEPNQSNPVTYGSCFQGKHSTNLSTIFPLSYTYPKHTLFILSHVFIKQILRSSWVSEAWSLPKSRNLIKMLQVSSKLEDLQLVSFYLLDETKLCCYTNWSNSGK